MCYTALLLLEVYQHGARRYGARFAGGTLSRTLRAVGDRLLHGIPDVRANRSPTLAARANCWPPASNPVAGLVASSCGRRVAVYRHWWRGSLPSGTSLVDLFNRFLFSAKIIFSRHYAGAAVAAAYPSHQSADAPAPAGLALSAIPVIFTSFGFHGGRCRASSAILTAIFVSCVGSLSSVVLSTLVAYIFWQLATLGSIDSPALPLLAQNAG